MKIDRNAVTLQITMSCLGISLAVSGFSLYRFSSAAWAAYLICTSYIGLRA
jgi:hypothetical protein